MNCLRRCAFSQHATGRNVGFRLTPVSNSRQIERTARAQLAHGCDDQTVGSMLNRREFYIDGAWVEPIAGRDFEVIDPSTEGTCAVISLGGQADTDVAVAAARRAFGGWGQSGKSDRLEALHAILAAYEARAADMGAAISLEMGAPVDLANSAQVGAGAWHIQGTIDALQAFEFDQMLGDHADNDRILHEPVGVVGLITPWNWPMNQVALKVAPAIAAGCTMVLKPSEIAPLSSAFVC